jgi:DNA-binding MarR family transcriptional regulator
MSNTSSGQFVMIPFWVQERLRDEHAAYHLYGRLRRYANGDGHAYPKRETLADDLGISVRTVQRLIDILRDRGVIRTARRYNASGWVSGLTYHLTETEADAAAFEKPKKLPRTANPPKGQIWHSGKNRPKNADFPECQIWPFGVVQSAKFGTAKEELDPEVRTTPLTPLSGGNAAPTKRELRAATTIRNTQLGCRHSPHCQNAQECHIRIVLETREREREAFQRVAAEYAVAEIRH